MSNIESNLVENRVFKPAKEFTKKARIQSMAQYRKMWEESVKRPEKFWAREASELVWQKKWGKVLDWKPPFAKWFVGGHSNICHNALDRHLATRGDQPALIFISSETDQKRTYTYRQL
ncbi:MAG TPA: acetyl-coenzyme A synthetase N-terminal domain-containing protein, partial [Chthoniobacteraceae bacterium]|nr:acetyl-coenzyme A synthetase N-terminal domain-containing protein [Chthoniobacteraceae bacterium]